MHPQPRELAADRGERAVGGEYSQFPENPSAFLQGSSRRRIQPWQGFAETRSPLRQFHQHRLRIRQLQLRRAEARPSMLLGG
ncbi:MAG: Uncharacterised protein [Synechococcus sp. CC9902]|nr:MAG: Uncharacterised protein [Synechococcus sp. CC9902]